MVKQVKKSAKVEEQFMRGEELLKRREQVGREAGLAEGHAKGCRDSLMIVLQTKGTVSEALSGKIAIQSDLEVLNHWIALAGRVSDIEEFERQINDGESEPL